MKKNKFFLATTVVLLAVGTAFGANKMHKMNTITLYYNPGSCTEVTCSTVGSGACVGTSNPQFYTNAGCSTPYFGSAFENNGLAN